MKPIEIKKILDKYLNKHYVVCNNKFYHVNTTQLEYGQDIVIECHVVFDFDILECEKIFRKWSFSNGLQKKEFGSAYKKPFWTVEMSDDLHAFHHIDAEAELINMLSQEISNEIDREIINDLIAINGNEIDREIITDLIAINGNQDITPYRED